MKKQKHTLIFGKHPVFDAIKSGANLDKIMIQQGIRGEFEKETRKLSKIHEIPLSVVPKERLNKFVGNGNHQGILAFLSLVQYYKLEDVLPGIYEKSETPLILLLDGVTDVRNFGAIARSAELCGVHAIVVPKKGSALINADAMKASAGALNNILVCRESSLATAIDFLKLSGIRVISSNLKGDKNIMEIDLKEPVAIVMGSEGEGVSPSILRQTDQQFIIPQVGITDSFNVSVATGIILYEVVRQRKFS